MLVYHFYPLSKYFATNSSKLIPIKRLNCKRPFISGTPWLHSYREIVDWCTCKIAANSAWLIPNCVLICTICSPKHMPYSPLPSKSPFKFYRALLQSLSRLTVILAWCKMVDTVCKFNPILIMFLPGNSPLWLTPLIVSVLSYLGSKKGWDTNTSQPILTKQSLQ